MGLEIGFLVAALGIAALDWVALHLGWRRVDYIAKPGVIVALMGALLLASTPPGEILFFLMILIGLIFSLAGDILLMVPKERFLAGLIAFVLAYFSYGVAFTPTPPPVSAGSIITILVCALVVINLLRAVFRGLKTTGRERMRIPTLIFGIIIFFMVSTALLTNFRPAWPAASAIAIGVGGVLIFLSDALLAWNRFVKPFPAARLMRRIPYHLGQIAICLGALLLTYLPY